LSRRAALRTGGRAYDFIQQKEINMEGPLRGLLAGAAAWKFGGGCISTILIFIIVFWLLGYVHC
jgi:hypothetical protein